MYKIVNTPFTGNYPTKLIMRSLVDANQDLINLAISTGLVIRASGIEVSIQITGNISDFDLSGWVDDAEPTTIIIIDAQNTTDPTGATVVLLYASLTKETRTALTIDGANSVLGIPLPLELAPVQQKLDSTNDLLLIELEKLLPADNAVRILREEIRNGEI